MKFISILYTIFSLFFLIFISIYKKNLEDILINLFVYFFILFIQYRVLMFNHKRLLNYLMTYEWLNHIILILGFFFILTIGVSFAKELIEFPFYYFVLMGCASSCFYTVMIVKHSSK